MSGRLTDKKAVCRALHFAIEWEESVIDAYHNDEKEEAVQMARRNIAAFTRVLDRYYGGRRTMIPSGLKSISIFELLRREDDGRE